VHESTSRYIDKEETRKVLLSKIFSVRSLPPGLEMPNAVSLEGLCATITFSEGENSGTSVKDPGIGEISERRFGKNRAAHQGQRSMSLSRRCLQMRTAPYDKSLLPIATVDFTPPGMAGVQRQQPLQIPGRVAR
jgi:hypothetical protein